ncbi:unnamed protein product [Leptidea sinapis]|uniref:Uncharacterized protein n=1 Tax=Leptidea sinapis TaxID=189913 RepID=A0A5E4PVF7_9NEOP|nr:unnamed protein product [Leptidea sinapis]
MVCRRVGVSSGAPPLGPCASHIYYGGDLPSPPFDLRAPQSRHYSPALNTRPRARLSYDSTNSRLHQPGPN